MLSWIDPSGERRSCVAIDISASPRCTLSSLSCSAMLSCSLRRRSSASARSRSAVRAARWFTAVEHTAAAKPILVGRIPLIRESH